MTGLYTLEVLTGNDVLLTSRQISVEEFIPDRLKVTVQATPAVAKPGQSVEAQITALNLFGPPAADRKFEVEFSLKQKVYSSGRFPDFSFAVNSGKNTQRNASSEDDSSLSDRFEKTVREGTTDSNGKGIATYNVSDYTDLGNLEGTAFATVFDESGRPVNRLATFEVRTQAVLFGIKKLPELVSTRQPVAIHVLSVKAQDVLELAPAQAEVKIVRLLWETVIERQGGRYTYVSQKKEQLMSSSIKQITNSATGRGEAGTRLDFTPVYSGEYEVRVSRPGAVTYVSQRFYAYGFGDTQSNSFEVNNEGEVTIEADKAKYQPGETASLLLKTPFPGRVLVTVERDKVLNHFYVNTDQKSARVRIPISAGHVPNVYVTATAIRAITDNRLPLTVARGFVPLSVEKPGTKLAVAIKAPQQSRSQTFQTIEVTTAPRAAVTLAVVDEGILQMKDYRTPDPYGHFYQKRALEVQAYDVYPFLLPELGGNSSTGGDGYDLGRRTTPVPSRRVQLVAKWSGILRADAQGKVRYRVRVPQFSGALRVMAVAYKGEAFGAAEHTMRVADPVVISTSLPRFLSPGDTIDVPVTLTNTTEKTITGQMLIRCEGPIAVTKSTGIEKGVGPGNVFYTDAIITLPVNSERRVVFRLIAKPEIGNSKVGVAFEVQSEKLPPGYHHKIYSEYTELLIRSASPLQKRTGSGVVAGGQIQNLNLKTDFLTASMRSQLVVSRSPMTEFAKDLRYLLQYPYGCLEQIVSAAFPQLYYGDLAATLSQQKGQQAKAAGYNPNYHVQEAIRKVEAQQLYNGSLSYWPGGDYDNWWATAYAAHFLLEAQQAGFQVNKAVLDKTLAYLQFRLRKRETEPYNYLDAKNAIHLKTIAKKEITYSLYVLALAGRQDAVALNYYKANRQLLSQDSRVLLAATYALNGDQRSFQAVLPTRLGTETAARRYFDGSFSSPLRDQALTLNALLAADPNNPQIAPQARQLSRQMKQAGWLSTQERAFGLLALGKIARQNARSTATATLLAEGKKLGEFLAKDLTVNNVANRALSLRTSGTGSLYYFWETEGISPGGQIQEEDAYLRVRRQYLNRAGQPIGNTFRQNDLVIVKITLQAPEAAGDIPNVAITDLLPAGLEIENPRIGAIRDITWATDAAQPDYLDLRDDRINLFTTATDKPKSFYYVARAVSKGTFRLGPVSADAMYNAEYHSYHGAGVVKVR
ncbi:hypothetical protein H9L05_03000 [Hymenobacter qilianensis]|nr:alpha-2-macroglobulin family protein [Hymenobacter qilianensis]QNP52731.1 hypothetical protein H9L05_03000 [Hymenobacter qilianensis]